MSYPFKEELLQFIWKQSCFGKALQTSDADDITIIHPGLFNTNEGPDFLNAKIRIGDTILAGHIEIHTLSSDWEKHGHQYNEKYKPVILHVLWKNDIDHEAKFPAIPYIELHKYISPIMIERYQAMMESKSNLPCQYMSHGLSDIGWKSWLDTLLAERWQNKYELYSSELDGSKYDWNELLYVHIARSLGQKINGEAMQMLCQSIPLLTLTKHKTSMLQVEALLFGVSGLLPETSDDEYVKSLIDESRFLIQKHKLQPLNKSVWNFGRLRPPNFPTIRIAQLASMVFHSSFMLSKLLECTTLKEVKALLEYEASPYWNTHFTFEHASEKSTKKKIGTKTIDNLIINTVAPIVWSYGNYHQQYDLQERALSWVFEIPKEENHKIKILETIGPVHKNAAHSQALIELYDEYCTQKKCLKCPVAGDLLKVD